MTLPRRETTREPNPGPHSMPMKDNSCGPRYTVPLSLTIAIEERLARPCSPDVEEALVARLAEVAA